MPRHLWIALAMSLTSIVLSGAVGDQPHAAAPSVPLAPEVAIDNFTFGPTEVKIPVGTTVTWVNRDDIPHTVVNTDKAFKSKVLDTDDKFSFTFTRAGKYPYFCSIHPKMTGTVIVE
ncbi:MAG TPA: cupredoxin family copper-binding protein [Vicinamibacterales bacterium]|jgi:plastocyanin|nr:cupredoxin family copper-binding protein [Vicinamibacterales bacterium]